MIEINYTDLGNETDRNKVTDACNSTVMSFPTRFAEPLLLLFILCIYLFIYGLYGLKAAQLAGDSSCRIGC